MAEREPIVIVNGQLRQLPSGDTLNIGYTPSGGAVLTFEATNLTGNTMNKLSAVYMSADDNIALTNAGGVDTSKFVGFIDAETTNNSTVNVQVAGVITGNSAEWNDVSDEVSGLSYGSIYYLQEGSPGKITANAPTTTTHYVKPVGLALSATKLLILQQQSILL